MIIENDGSSFPPIIREIGDLDNVYFAGSGLLKHIFFENENWKNNDYDIWCNKTSFIQIRKILENNKDFSPEYLLLNDSEELNRYTTFENRIEFIVECFYQNIKLQFIFTKADFDDYIDNFDFSILRFYYNKRKLHFIGTTPDEIKTKKVKLIRLSKNEDRVKKYEERGFIFNKCSKCGIREKKQNENKCKDCLRPIIFEDIDF